jgi:D-alanyl-D-alanine carboxypeptidase
VYVCECNLELKMRLDVTDRARAATPALCRILACLLTLVPCLAAGGAAARSRAAAGAYAPPVSAMVVDPVSQKTLYEQDADGPRHPASLTKVMTLYILFEELQGGGLRLDSPLTASWKAINQAPSRLGLEKGQTITVEEAIKAVVTRSANDVAFMIAENISGTDAAFVERMNATAKRLGMLHTTFTNPTGLPDRSQLTTARDLVTLGQAIRDTYPTLFGYFSLRGFDYDGKTILSHNRLMTKLQGMDGIKTGFTNASGFNLLASVRRDGKSVVAVVIGGSTARQRDARMTELVEKALPLAADAPPPAPPVVVLEDSGFHRGAPIPVEPAGEPMLAEALSIPDAPLPARHSRSPWRTWAGASALALAAAAAGFAWRRRDWPVDVRERLAGLIAPHRPLVHVPIREVSVLPSAMLRSDSQGEAWSPPLRRAS